MRDCRSLWFRVAAVAGAAVFSLFSGTGCGLISSDIT
jgi:hypothetical protein